MSNTSAKAMEGAGWLPGVLDTPCARGPFELAEKGSAATAAEQPLRRPGGRAAFLPCCGDVKLLSPTYSLQSRLHTTASRSASLLREHQAESRCDFVSRRKAIMKNIRRKKSGVPPRSFISKKHHSGEFGTDPSGNCLSIPDVNAPRDKM